MAANNPTTHAQVTAITMISKFTIIDLDLKNFLPKKKLDGGPFFYPDVLWIKKTKEMSLFEQVLFSCPYPLYASKFS
jgi:hypothetical protein